jgi:import inner membrane translocase subunit TIM23
MYCFMGSSLNFFFEDEIAELSQFQKNSLCGVLTGALYKSTLGIRPMVVGGILGGALSSGLHQGIGYLNEKGYIAFEMKY